MRDKGQKRTLPDDDFPALVPFDKDAWSWPPKQMPWFPPAQKRSKLHYDGASGSSHAAPPVPIAQGIANEIPEVADNSDCPTTPLPELEEIIDIWLRELAADKEAATDELATNDPDVPPSSADAVSDRASGSHAPHPESIWHREASCISKDYKIPPEYQRTFDIANEIIKMVKESLPFGSANQWWNFFDQNGQPSSGPEARKRVDFLYSHAHCYMRQEIRRLDKQTLRTWVQWKADEFEKSITEFDNEEIETLKNGFKSTLYAELTSDSNITNNDVRIKGAIESAIYEYGERLLWQKPRLRAHAALVAQAANCDHMAALSYTLAREQFGSDYMVQLAWIKGHIFCRVRNVNWPNPDVWVVIDPWPRDAYAVWSEDHLSYGHDISVYPAKPGKGGPSNEKSERYDQFRTEISRGLHDFEQNTWPAKDKSQWPIMHNALYPTPTTSSYRWRYPVYSPTTRGASEVDGLDPAAELLQL